MDLNEAETRKKVIDPKLELVGWIKKYIKEEVNSLKSNFKTKEYVLFSGDIEKGKDRFIDYLLLDENNSPLAIVEVKKTSVSVEKGEIQAKTYQEDIKKQTKKIVPIFLTNGETWYLIDQKDRRRKVLLPLSQKDLRRKNYLFEHEIKPSQVKLNKKIVDRARSVEAVKQVLEHYEKGYISALVNMATGTGKTRVAMAIIDALIKSNYVKNVLFVVDRISLSNQAKERGFKSFFSDPVCELNVEGFSDTATLYASTVQTLTDDDNKRKRPMFEKFGVGGFDLIIFDEAHRSFYGKNNILFDYFDCLKLGLTAAPSSEETRDTFELFDCEYKKPTVAYDYDTAVNDNVLVPYVADVIDTQVLTLGIKAAKLTRELKQALKEQEENPEITELLFLELMYNSLASGGRCAVIVPDGVLFGNSKSHKAIRQLLLEKCRLDAIIKMPSGVFKPYAGVSTAVLFFTKGEPTQKVWFYDMQSDGFSLDDKRTQIGDGKGDIPDIIERFEKRKEELNDDRKKKHFFVPQEEIKKNDWDLSISKYKEIEYEEVEYEKPAVLKKKILELEEDIVKELKSLDI